MTQIMVTSPSWQVRRQNLFRTNFESQRLEEDHNDSIRQDIETIFNL